MKSAVAAWPAAERRWYLDLVAQADGDFDMADEVPTRCPPPFTSPSPAFWTDAFFWLEMELRGESLTRMARCGALIFMADGLKRTANR